MRPSPHVATLLMIGLMAVAPAAQAPRPAFAAGSGTVNTSNSGFVRLAR